MAEGWARYFHSDKFDIYSAGIEKHGMNARAIQVMKESGVDISSHLSKTLEDIGSVHFDTVYTVCGHANEHCPLFTGNAKVIHVGFEDPPKLTKTMTDEEEVLSHYRRVRDEIKQWVQSL